MEFRKGDAVRLKSGGPVMIVDSIKEGYVKCVWMDKDQESTICIQFLELFKKKETKSMNTSYAFVKALA